MSTVLRRLVPILRWRYAILFAIALVAAYRALPPGLGDWPFFSAGSRLLFGDHANLPRAQRPGGFHLYANYPDLQIGPLTFLVVTPIRLLFGNDGSRGIAVMIMTAMAPALVGVLEHAAKTRTEGDASVVFRQACVLFGGAFVVYQWAWLGSRYAHIDDALTLLFACGALWGITKNKPLLVGIMIGLAVAAKPWGLVLLPVALVFSGRARWRATIPALVLTGVAWIPFVIVDTGTLTAATPVIPASPASVLHLLGMAGGDAPSWVRPAQFGAAMAIGVLAVRRGGWAAVLMIGIAVRILLDPGVFEYYTSGLVLAAFAWEMLRSSRPVPVLTVSLFALLQPGLAHGLGGCSIGASLDRLPRCDHGGTRCARLEAPWSTSSPRVKAGNS